MVKAPEVLPSPTVEPSKKPTDPKERERKRSIKRGVALATASAVGIAGIALAPRIIEGDSTPEVYAPRTPLTQPETITKEPYQAHGVLYEVEGKQWFGGFDINIPTRDGKNVGFTDPVKGPKDLYDQILLMLLEQTGGKYGKTLEELEAYLRTHKAIIPDFRYPKKVDEDDVSFGSYVLPSEPVKLDLSLPFVINQHSIPRGGGSKIVFGDYQVWDAIGVTHNEEGFKDGQLVYTVTDAASVDASDAVVTDPNDIVVAPDYFSGGVFLLLETTARINEAREISDPGLEATLTEIVSNLGGGPDYHRKRTILDRDVFWKPNQDFTENVYSIFNAT